MNRCFLRWLFLAGLWPFGLFAQTPDYQATHQVIASTGNTLTRQGLTWSYTVGEPIIHTFHNTGLRMVFTQGFHQPEISRSVRVFNTGQWPVDWQASVFPNPAVDVFTLSIDQTGLFLWVTDAAGRTYVDPHPIQSPEAYRVSCGQWPPGLYLLHLQRPHTTQRGVLRVVVLPN